MRWSLQDQLLGFWPYLNSYVATGTAIGSCEETPKQRRTRVGIKIPNRGVVDTRGIHSSGLKVLALSNSGLARLNRPTKSTMFILMSVGKPIDRFGATESLDAEASSDESHNSRN